MKKLFCVLLVLITVLSLAACGKGEQNMVAIYIPDTDVQIDPDSTIRTVTYLFEEGWQEKESFRVTYSGDTEILGVGNDAPSDVFSGNTIITEIAGVKRSEATYDQHGRQISRITPFISENANMAKMEFTYTYDALGRRLSQTTKYSYPDKTEIETQTYTYEDMETGSKGTCTEGNTTYVLEYDKNGKLIVKATITDGQEVSRTESEYDQHGNWIRLVSYAYGQKQFEQQYTYKVVEVTEETANRLPWFNRKN